MTLALAIPQLSFMQVVVGVLLLAWAAFVLVIAFGSRVHGAEPAAPSEPESDDIEALFEDWPTNGRRP